MNVLTPEQREMVARLQSGRLMICDGQGDPNSDGCGGQGYTGAAGQEPCRHCYGAGVMTPELRRALASAPAPSDPAGAGGDLGELERLSKAATSGEWKLSGQFMSGDWIVSTPERVIANCRPWSMRADDERHHADAAFIVAAVAFVRDLIASRQETGSVDEIPDEAIQAALKAYHETHDTANVDDEPEDLDHAAMEAALYEAAKFRSGQIIASTGEFGELRAIADGDEEAKRRRFAEFAKYIRCDNGPAQTPQIVASTPGQKGAGEEKTGADWLDQPIGGDLAFEGMRFGKGVPLRTVIKAAQRWRRDARAAFDEKVEARKSDGGARILAGLDDALAWTGGDTSRAELVTVKDGQIVGVPAPTPTARDHVASARLIPWEPGSLGGVDLTFESGLRVALPLSEPETPARTPQSPPSATPEGDPPMTVEEARAIVSEVQRFNPNPAAYAVACRGIGRVNRAIEIEAALRTLHAAGEVR